MRYRPSLDEFRALAATYTIVPVYRQLVGDTLTPVTAFRAIQEGDWSFLFESVIGGERLGRYSILGSGPFLTFEAHDRSIAITDRRSGQQQKLRHDDPLRLLEEMLTHYRAPQMPRMPRFLGGAVGYAGYDTVRYVERLEHPPADDRGLPDLCFGLYDRMVIFDHINKTVAVVAHAHVPAGTGEHDLRRAYEAACSQVDTLVERLQRRVADLPLTDIAPGGRVSRAFTSNMGPGAYERAVENAKEYIRAGDIF